MRHRSGQALLLVALALVVLLGMVAASITYGVVAFSQTKLQNAVDAAALAGAQRAMEGENPTTDQAWLQQQNLGPNGAMTVTYSKSVVNGIRATGVVTVPGGFAGVVGIKQFTVRATAVATYGPPSPFDYAIYQHSTQTLTSNQVMNVTGAVHTNGPLTMDGTYCVTNGLTYGEGSPTLNGSPTCPTALVDNGAQPWPATWTLAEVTPPNATVNTQNNFDASQGQPYVVNGNMIFDPSSGTVNFNQGLEVNGNVLIEGNVNFDVSLVVNGSIVVWGGSANLNQGITQPTPGSSGVGLAVMGPPGGTYNLTIDVGGNQTGVLYAPQGTITLNKGIDLTGSLIAQNLTLDSTVDVSYNSSLLPPSFPITETVQLVQ